MSTVIAKTGMTHILGLLLTGAFLKANYNIRLFKNNVIPSFATILTDLQEADFDGYTNGTGPVPDAPKFYDGLGDGILWPAHLTFLCSGSTTPNTVYGWYVTFAGPPEVLVYCKLLDVPMNFAASGDNLLVEWPFAMGQPQGQ